PRASRHRSSDSRGTMAIRKSVEEIIVVPGARETWIKTCRDALISSRFANVESSDRLFQVSGEYHTITTWGDIQVTLLPEDGNTRLVCRATAGVDNIWALFKSPTRTILSQFKQALGH